MSFRALVVTATAVLSVPSWAARPDFLRSNVAAKPDAREIEYQRATNRAIRRLIAKEAGLDVKQVGRVEHTFVPVLADSFILSVRAKSGGKVYTTVVSQNGRKSSELEMWGPIKVSKATVKPRPAAEKPLPQAAVSPSNQPSWRATLGGAGAMLKSLISR
jgi:hypothetical protein